MAKKKFQVYYSVTLETSRVIAADSDEEAERIAEELRFDSDFHNDLIDSFENDYEGWRSKYIKVELDGEVDEDEPADNEEE